MSSSIFTNLTRRWSPYHRPRPKLQIPTIPIDGEKSAEEIALEEAGDLNALQRYRHEVHKITRYEHHPPITELLETEEDFRHHFQLELSLRERNDQSEEVQEDLKTQRKLLWMLSREWWMLKNEFGEGVVKRAFDLWRSHPRWYMHQVLVEDCIGKQGCCSRGCGCCVKRPISPARKIGVGHCTLACECCREARGFDLSEEEHERIQGYYDYRNTRNAYDRIELAAFWGLCVDSCESPFDMIDESPVFPFGNGKAEILGLDEEDNESTSAKDSELTLT
ncbi:unnamed protein product [Penicillium camemberti]|uniref:Str. FM013 n=1 Tax=Penicillium camemberti (strain FM 013) TaxID=1429867 RepID=A0A0G4P6H4_PENC3|nr:unnamed protein product [Penicillium camemberti]